MIGYHVHSGKVVPEVRHIHEHISYPRRCLNEMGKTPSLKAILYLLFEKNNTPKPTLK